MFVMPEELENELRKKIKNLETKLEKAKEVIEEYVAHDDMCILSRWSAGRPAEDGGYESKYAGKWYKRGEEPKCNCGLEQALKKLEG